MYKPSSKITQNILKYAFRSLNMVLVLRHIRLDITCLYYEVECRLELTRNIYSEINRRKSSESESARTFATQCDILKPFISSIIMILFCDISHFQGFTPSLFMSQIIIILLYANSIYYASVENIMQLYYVIIEYAHLFHIIAICHLMHHNIKYGSNCLTQILLCINL